MTTTDDVADALVKLTASVATDGQADSVSIPIVSDDGTVGAAELVIGVGNDVLSSPSQWTGSEPDFSTEAAALRGHASYPRVASTGVALNDADSNTDRFYDPDLEGFLPR